MAATCFLRDIVQQKGHHQALWFTIMLLFIAVAGIKEPILLKGHVGGDAVFPCPVEQNVSYDFLYLQKGDVFVNGFYKSNNVNEHNPWPNSRVEQKVIIMSGLNISHAGLYTCHFQKTGIFRMEEANIKLTVTANYSNPSISSRNCIDKNDACLVLCSAHGGYPNKKIIWNTLEGYLSTEDSSTEDNDTLLLNISSEASFNCSTGKQQNISCSVDHRVSAVLHICKQENAPEKINLIPIIVPVVLLVVFFGIIIVCYTQRNRIRSCCCDNNLHDFEMVQNDANPE